MTSSPTLPPRLAATTANDDGNRRLPKPPKRSTSSIVAGRPIRRTNSCSLGGSREDFTRLAGLLAGLKGKFILSLNDTPGVRNTFAGFNVEAVKTRYSISAKANQAVGEVLIANFKLAR